MYLHKDDKELLRDIIVTVSERTGIDESIVEKDYYVTMILKELVQRNPNVVFKGGTSLSKAYHVIDRFSEDIDITFEEHLGEARRKKIKYQLLQPISEDLDLAIDNGSLSKAIRIIITMISYMTRFAQKIKRVCSHM